MGGEKNYIALKALKHRRVKVREPSTAISKEGKVKDSSSEETISTHLKVWRDSVQNMGVQAPCTNTKEE